MDVWRACLYTRLRGTILASEAVDERPDSVRSVERALSIVGVLAENRGSLSVGEVAAQMQLHPATVHRLLATLVRLGWVEQNSDTARYKPGVRLLGVGAAALHTHPLVQHSKESLRRLAEVSEYTAYLSVPAGRRVVYLARTAGKRSMSLEFEAGASQPVFATADGKLLLAYLPESERELLLQALDLRRYTANTLAGKEQLLRELGVRRSPRCPHDLSHEESDHALVPVAELLRRLLVGGEHLVDDRSELAGVGDLAKARTLDDRVDRIAGLDRFLERLLRARAADRVVGEQSEQVGQVLRRHPGRGIRPVLVREARQVLRDPVRGSGRLGAQGDRLLEQRLGLGVHEPR